jgi:K+-sensing histidine kinase KdpD
MMFFLGKPVAEPNSNAIQERRTMARANQQLRLARSSVLRYGLAATSSAIALTVWYAGPVPGILAVVLSSLPEQQSDQIFNGFFTTKRQGIGIASRSIVELHRGRLWAEKNTGCGAIFLFSLPVAGGSVL